jgi:hypothetical protein
MKIAPVVESRGGMFLARGRLGKGGAKQGSSVLSEEALYRSSH